MGRANLKNAVVVSEDDDHIMGRITLATNPDREINGAKLLRSWAQNGLELDDLPDARQPVNVFQSACASVKEQRAARNGEPRMAITADEVADNGTCDYQIGVKVWDVANKLIEYRRDMLVTFNKQTSQITTDRDPADTRLGAVEDEIRSHFDANAKTVPGQKVRNAVRATLLRVGAQNLRRKSGGVYFVPATYKRMHNGTEEIVPTKPILEGLQKVLAAMYRGDADFHILPCADGEGEREMVRKHFAINANQRAADLSLKAISRLREGGKRGVRSDFMLNMENERRQLLASVDDFDALVTLEKRELSANLRELEESMRKLREFADKSEKEAADKKGKA